MDTDLCLIELNYNRSFFIMIHVVIGGDICPVGRSTPYFIDGDAPGIFNDLLNEFEKADLTVVNLECPLIKKESPILKSGPVLGADSVCVNGLKNAHIQVVGLANNHIMDHGAEGLRNTISVCRDAGLAIVGAGENLSEAADIFIQNTNGIRIAVMALAEHEFSIATKSTPGANPLDLIEYVRSVRRHQDEYDYLIVLLHGGKEHYPYPSPVLQQTCRFMIEEGAGAVICQHSHCPGCYEEWNGGHIVYGQGNLIFDGGPKNNETWHKGFLVKFNISLKKDAEIEFIPYLQSNEQPGARRMSLHQNNAFTERVKNRSERVKNETYIEKKWHEISETEKYYFFSTLRGHNQLFRSINKFTHFTNIIYSQKQLLALQNIVNCESHRELLQCILSKI